MDDGDGERKPLADAERQFRGALIEIIGEAELRDELGERAIWPFAAGR